MMQRHKIEGVVLDSENNPIEGVSVKMYRGLFGQIDLIGEVQTKQDGRYEIGFDGGSSIRIVRYDYLFHGLDSCHPGLVTNIAGVQDHILNKVMYKAGMAYDKDELLDILKMNGPAQAATRATKVVPRPAKTVARRSRKTCSLSWGPTANL